MAITPIGNESAFLSLKPAYTFDRFIKGSGNDLACSACQAVADTPGKSYNPLFIYGRVGLGKTHLLHAIGNEVLKSQIAQRVIYITSERFAIELVHAIRSRHMDRFRHTFRQADILLIDDVHFLQGKEGIEDELFHTFNDLHGSGKQIVLSSDRPPHELAQMQERLVSRFRWGMVADIHPPNYETRLAILKAKAKERGLEFDLDILSLIAQRITSSVRALEGALTRAAAYAELQGKPLTCDKLVKILTPETLSTGLSDIEMIKAEVARYYGIKVTQLDGKRREKRIAQARHIAMYLARELTTSSFPTIGQAFGQRDHATVMHACRKVRKLMETPLLRHDIENLRNRLQEIQSHAAM
jgi:chromosomal replication initiator protein